MLSAVGAKNSPATIPGNAVTELELQVRAAGLLWQIFGDRQSAQALIKTLQERNDVYLRKFTTLTELLIESDNASPILETLTPCFDGGAPAFPGDPWLVWLLNLRRSKKVGGPPVESCAWAVVPDEASMWLPAFTNAGAQMWPFLDEFRDRFMVFHAESGSTNQVRFLGILDGMEIAKLQQKKP